MIVEDEMLLALESRGYPVGSRAHGAGKASDMSEALILAERCEGRIDVAIMDVNLARVSNGWIRLRHFGSNGTSLTLRQRQPRREDPCSGACVEADRFRRQAVLEREVLAAIASVTKATV